MTYLRELAMAIQDAHGVEARHLETVPLRELFQGKVAWEGEVEVFEIMHPSGAMHCYAWGYVNRDDPGALQCVCVLEGGPVVSPLTAVQANIRFQRDARKSS